MAMETKHNRGQRPAAIVDNTEISLPSRSELAIEAAFSVVKATADAVRRNPAVLKGFADSKVAPN